MTNDESFGCIYVQAGAHNIPVVVSAVEVQPGQGGADQNLPIAKAVAVRVREKLTATAVRITTLGALAAFRILAGSRQHAQSPLSLSHLTSIVIVFCLHMHRYHGWTFFCRNQTTTTHQAHTQHASVSKPVKSSNIQPRRNR